MAKTNIRIFYGLALGLVLLLMARAWLSRPLTDQGGSPTSPAPTSPSTPPKPLYQADVVDESQPDSQFQGLVDQYVQRLGAKGHETALQGVWVQAGGRMLAQHEGTTRLPAASLTKLATTLLALDTWPSTYRFVTRVYAQGPVENGVLNGDLIIRGGGDPLFVWESAIALGNQIQAQGIQKVQGRLIVGGIFAMNFQRDSAQAAELLRQGLNAELWGWEAELQHQKLPPGTPKPTLKISGGVALDSQLNTLKASTSPVVEYPSADLKTILKKMNIYSNNEMAQMLMDLLGGPTKLEERVVALTGVAPTEVQFINGSGLGHENQLSPRASCRILDVLGKQLQPQGVGLRDVLPIVPEDDGTLVDRPLPKGLIGKTGTLSDVSNLAGLMRVSSEPALSVQEPETLCFVIQNRGWDLDYLYKQQEVVLSALKPRVASQPAPAPNQAQTRSTPAPLAF